MASYLTPPVRQTPPRELAEASHFVRTVRPAGPHLAVVLTVVGSAQTVALALDHAGFPEVVGTVAGDDTIFVATATAARPEAVPAASRRAADLAAV